MKNGNINKFSCSGFDSRHNKQPAALFWQHFAELCIVSCADKHPRRTTGNRIQWVFSTINSIYTMVFCRNIWSKIIILNPNTLHPAVCTDICRWLNEINKQQKRDCTIFNRIISHIHSSSCYHISNKIWEKHKHRRFELKWEKKKVKERDVVKIVRWFYPFFPCLCS